MLMSSLRLSAHTFTCSTSGLVVMLFFSGDKYCFYGTAKIQCLAGEFYVDDCKMPSGENIDFDSMRHVCAPYRLSRPAVLRTVPGNEDAPKYKLARLKYRLKEITPHFERIMEVIGEKYPAVVLVDRKPSQTVHVLDQVLQDFFVPSWLRPSCQFDRTVYFTADFDLYTDNSLYSLRGAMKDVNNQRAEGKRVVVVPVGSCGSGKSSLVRYLVNTNFKRDGPEIYLLDADVGQSEFTPAGCMSLWKIADVVLDVPCTHQAQVFPCSYFFGNISPADDTDKYREIFDQLMNDFHAASEPGALLIVNTLGWIEGLGLELLRHIFDVSRPALAISLSHDRGCSLVPRWVPLRIEVSTRFAPSCHHLKVPEEYSYPSRLVAYQLRDLAMVSYFSPVLPRPVLSSICDTTPYCVKFEYVRCCHYAREINLILTISISIFVKRCIRKRVHLK
ncbi:hypothetical protein Q1695_006789 [Nippostrongylus brasiliensis]|nr:hypothetical protein Q1695_006789 [Nippostrongylus brasiliensis]